MVMGEALGMSNPNAQSEKIILSNRVKFFANGAGLPLTKSSIHYEKKDWKNLIAGVFNEFDPGYPKMDRYDWDNYCTTIAGNASKRRAFTSAHRDELRAKRKANRKSKGNSKGNASSVQVAPKAKAAAAKGHKRRKKIPPPATDVNLNVSPKKIRTIDRCQCDQAPANRKLCFLNVEVRQNQSPSIGQSAANLPRSVTRLPSVPCKPW